MSQTPAAPAAKQPAKPSVIAKQAAKPSVKANPMRAPYIQKIVVNIGVGEGGEKLVKATKVLEMLTKQKPVKTISKTINREWGIRIGMPIGCKVTLRGEPADDFLKRALWITQNKVVVYSFDKEGNFSLGVKDYTDFQGMKYDPEIGIFGLDISVTMRRRGGASIPLRKRNSQPLPKKQRLTTKESIEFLKNRFQIEVVR